MRNGIILPRDPQRVQDDLRQVFLGLAQGRLRVEKARKGLRTSTVSDTREQLKEADALLWGAVCKLSQEFPEVLDA